MLLAGCATPDASREPTPSGGAIATTPATGSSAPAPTIAPTSSGPRLGVVFDETFDFDGNQNETRRRFTIDRGVGKISFHVDSAGKPADGSFVNAVMDVYSPGSTGAMFAELPGQNPARNYTVEQNGFDPYWGEWMVRFAGQGKTSVRLVVTAS